MPDPTPQPQSPTPAPDVAAHLTALADAMRQLAESQKALTEMVKGHGAAKPAANAAPMPASADIGGDPAGGVRPAAVVDYSRLSPVQQITLGLKDAQTRPAPRPSAGAD